MKTYTITTRNHFGETVGVHTFTGTEKQMERRAYDLMGRDRCSRYGVTSE